MKMKVCHTHSSQCNPCSILSDLFCLSKRISSEDSPTLAAAFEEKARSTHKLVAAFVQLSGANPLKDEIYRRYQRSQTEVCCPSFSVRASGILTYSPSARHYVQSSN